MIHRYCCPTTLTDLVSCTHVVGMSKIFNVPAANGIAPATADSHSR